MAGQTDAVWLAAGERYPPAEPRDWRDLTRDRAQLGQERSREVNRVRGGLEGANIQMASVASDIRGVSGRALLAALIDGRAEPAAMAALAKGRWRHKIPVLEPALTGLVPDHHRRLLALQVAHMDFVADQLEALSADITRRLSDLSAVPLTTPPAPPAGGTREGGTPAAPGPPAPPCRVPGP